MGADFQVDITLDDDGKGPYGIDDFDINITKTGEINKTLGYKKGLNYNEKTKKIEWKIVANYYPENLKNVEVTDVLSSDVQHLMQDDAAVSYKVWNRTR